MPDLSNQDWLDFLGTPKKKAVDPYLALGKAGLENPTPDLLSSLAGPPSHPGGPLTQADLDFLPPRQEPRTALQSPTPPLPPPPLPPNAGTTPLRSSQAPWEPAPQDVAPEVDGEQAPPPLTGGNNVDWNEVNRNNASLANPAMPVQGTQASNPMLLDDIEARAARQKSGQNASVVLQPDEDSLPMEQGPKPASPVMAQTVEPKGYDPINLLQEQYRDAIRATASARQHDLSEQEMQKYLMLASSGAQHAGGNAGAAAALGQEAAKLQAAPLQMNSLQKQAEVMQTQAKAAKETWELDPESPTSMGAQMSFIASNQFNEIADRMAKDGKLDPVQARQKLYGEVKQLNSVGLDTFQKIMKNTGDYNAQAVHAALEEAQKDQHRMLTRQLRAETVSRETLLPALNSGDSAISWFARNAVKSMMPNEVAQIPPDVFSKMTANEIQSQFPGMAGMIAEYIKFGNVRSLQVEEQKNVNDKWQIRTGRINAPGTPMNGQEAVPEVAKAMAPKFNEMTRAVPVAMQSYDALAKRAAGGPEAMANIKLNSQEGQDIRNEIQTFINYAAIVSPVHAEALKQQLAVFDKSGSINLWAFVWGSEGTQSTLESAFRNMNANYSNMAGMYERKDMSRGEVPVEPPIHLPVVIGREKTGYDSSGQVMEGPTYSFRINEKTVKYWTDENGNWKKQTTTKKPKE